jgi:putative acetyltransferase
MPGHGGRRKGQFRGRREHRRRLSLPAVPRCDRLAASGTSGLSIHERAFAPSKAEARLVEALRESDVHLPELCLVAIRDQSIAGHIFFSRARLAGGPQVLALAPMAVLPEHQRKGAGGALLAEALTRAEETEFPLVVVVGHADYYPGFGFEPADPIGIKAPFDVPPEAWMAYRLPTYTPETRGTVIYPEGFAHVT